jgi:threonine synthase
MIACTNCHRPYPETGTPYRCPKCRAIFDYSQPANPSASSGQALQPFDKLRAGLSNFQPDLSLPGIWRYRSTFNLPESAPVVSLGEGNTPLVWVEAFGRRVALKCEFQNPTGSFKDRGEATLVSFLSARGVTEAVEDSSGNAGASFAAYAARAGMKARVYVPEAASGPKRRQIEAYGAEVISVPGPRLNATEAVLKEADGSLLRKATPYASHAYLPFNLPGYATLAYELFEQLGKAPETVIIPAGQGGLLLGVARGFENLRVAGVIESVPRLIGVQAQACAPLWALATFGPAGLLRVVEATTQAEGVRVKHPLRGEAVICAVEASGGQFVAISEEQISPARDELARRGFYVEPTSAIAWCALAQALAQLADSLPDPVVVVLTGAGLKSG